MQQACVEITRAQVPGSAEPDACDREQAISMTPTAWVAAGDLSMLEWSRSGQRLGMIGRASGWWIGDWVNYGNTRFGERYVRAARITGYDVQTLMNMVYVASRFEPPRRRHSLSWSHHAEVAALNPDDQDYWLETAEVERMSVRCLREQVRQARRREREAEAKTEPPAADRSEFVCPECGAHFRASEPHVAGAAVD